MRPSDNIEKLFLETSIETNTDVDKLVLDDAVNSMFKSKQKKPADIKPNTWRIIMNNRITKYAVAAMVMVAISIGLNTFTGTPAWAIDQTVKALEDMQTIVISGTDFWDPERMPFKLWVRFPENKKELIDLRFESEEQTIVVKGTKAWAYLEESNVVKIYDNIVPLNSMMRELAFWYQMTEHNSRIPSKVLSTLKLFSDDWQEDYRTYEKTGRDCVFVTCSYEPLSCSFWFVCDIESKLIVEGKYWKNTTRQGEPVFHAVSFKYNEELNDETFDFITPEGAEVLNREIVNRKEQAEAEALFERGEKLFEEKDIDQAIKIYQDVYEKYPNLNEAASALMMIGICYDHLEQYEKAISVYQKSVKEFEHLKGWTFSTYYYLGRAYEKNGQMDKALEAFQNCIVIGESIGGDADKFPLKDAYQEIEGLKSYR